MQKLFLAAFIFVWAAVVLLFGKRFFRALRARQWGNVILYGIALSLLIPFVELFITYAYFLQNPSVFL